ncbi:diacylglycerol kinase family protein [Vibrio hepatarius]|uniref:diacylglycerol kinase family protein n=1 Tax=Vibrio hepatarius TaxID=171383 RepID=UPI00142D8312|nr:diacylglycerol kinase family protein [Vibrio hepatarius]NIY81835.1 hypothetical protein [Vibrio hepatarius]
MRIATYYMCGSIVAFVLSLLSPWRVVAILMLWTTISLALVALAYYKNNGRIFRKRSDGTIPKAVRVLFWPFMLGVYTYNRVICSITSLPSIQKIESGLFLAARLTPADVESLHEHEIDAVLDVTAEFESLNVSLVGEGIEYLNVPVLDHAYPDFPTLLKAVRWIESQRKNNRSVVVHCALGRGRSVMIMVAYLLARDPDKSIVEVMEQIQSIRHRARLNSSQYKALQEYIANQEFGLAKPQIVIIANPVSGGGKWPENKADILTALSPYFTVEVKETTEEITAEQLAKQALAQQTDMIIAAGGDGTVNEVAAEIVGSNIRFAILPCGTANALCHAMWGIRSKFTPITMACDAIIHGDTRMIDVAQCNDQIALLIVAVGFEQQMIEFANRDEKNNDGQGAYLKGFLNAVTSGEVLSLYVRFDDQDEQMIDTHSMVIANAAPFSTLLAQGSGEPDINDGKLDVTWIPEAELPGMHVLSLTELVLSGFTSEKIGGFTEHKQVQSVHIHHPDGLKYVIDGELFESERLQIKVKPDALSVMSPKEPDLEEVTL